MAKLKILLCVLAIAGCSSLAHVEKQALPIGAEDLKSIKEQLVMMSVRIRPATTGLQVNGMLATHVETGKLYNFSFNTGYTIGSARKQPFTLIDDTVEQLVLLDLPAGTYSVMQVFFGFAHSASVSDALRHQLERPIQFQISRADVTYLGRLTMNVENLAATDLFGQDIRPSDGTVEVDLLDNVSGDVTVAIAEASAEDIERAKGHYPALTQQNVSIGKMSLLQ